MRVLTKYKAPAIVAAISCRLATAKLKRDEKKQFPVKQCLHFKAQGMTKLKSYLKTHETLEAFNKSGITAKTQRQHKQNYATLLHQNFLQT